MPVDDPQVGETWRLTDPFGQKSQEAVIIHARPGRPDSAAALVLMNRLGRRVTVARTLFTLSWHFQHEAHKPDWACWYTTRPERCVQTAYFQVQGAEGWVRVCPEHIPAGQTVLLPHETPSNRALLAEVGCPICQATIRAPGIVSESTEALPITICGRCHQRWVRIDVDSTNARQTTVLEQIVRAAATIDGPVQAMVGFEAWSVIRPRGSNVALQDITLVQSPRIGPRTIIVTNAPAPKHLQSGTTMTPAIGSIWRQIKGDRLAEILRIETDLVCGTRVVLQLADQSEPTTLPIREFASRFMTGSQYDAEVQVVAGPPDRRARPILGDTWWSREARRPVLVMSAAFDEIGNEVVKFQDGSTETVLSTNMFLEQFQIEPPLPECQVGEEWNNREPNALVITGIDMAHRQIHGARLGVPEVVSLATFVLQFTKVVRRTVYDLIDD